MGIASHSISRQGIKSNSYNLKKLLGFWNEISLWDERLKAGKITRIILVQAGDGPFYSCHEEKERNCFWERVWEIDCCGGDWQLSIRICFPLWKHIASLRISCFFIGGLATWPYPCQWNLSRNNVHYSRYRHVSSSCSLFPSNWLESMKVQL